MTVHQRNEVLAAAKVARAAGRKAHIAAMAAGNRPFNKALAKAAGLAATEAYDAAQAAEGDAMNLDPEEALEIEAVWEIHCLAMGAADAARKAADEAFHRA